MADWSKRVHALPGVTITDGPSDWTIVQRKADGTADMTIAGTWLTPENDFSVQVRVVDEATQAPVTAKLDWHDAELDREAGTFLARICNIPQGGLYRIETRIRRPFAKDPRATRGDCIHHLGVGDLYVIAGQSNASGTGKGTVNDGPQLGVHLFGNDERWRLATHPLEDATNTLHPITVHGVFHGHSPWLAFGKAIVARTGIPVGLIPAALGGSPVRRWTGPGLELFDNMADMIAKAGGRIAGILWYQGETDAASHERTEAYADAFRSFVAAAREMCGDDSLPVLTAQLNRKTSCDAAADRNWSAIRETQRQLAAEIADLHLIVTIDCSLSDVIHNNSASNVAIGERFAATALEHVYRLPADSRYPAPAEVTAEGEDRSRIRVRFADLSGDWTPSEQIGDFTVEDEAGFVELESVIAEANHDIVIRLARPPVGRTTLHGLYGADPVISLRDDQCRCIVPFSIVVA
ncbi:sialate O-acetylesterase [Paenibacillus sp. MBLB4367]|uniref:sialate O-acetylesterase n=1 Tax=Paenibacillus sp. MBLB4367 TaxID=3384767 RepID=UPI00390843CF